MTKKKSKAEDRGPYRSIYCALFDNEEFRNLPPECRHILVFLKLSRFNNPAGIFFCDEGVLLTIANYVGYSLDVVQKAVNTLSDRVWIGYQYPILWITNSLKFEPGFTLNNAKHVANIYTILRSLPKKEIVANFCRYYELDIPDGYPFDTLPDTLSNGYRYPMRYRETETDTERDIYKNPDFPEPPLKETKTPTADFQYKNEIKEEQIKAYKKIMLTSGQIDVLAKLYGSEEDPRYDIVAVAIRKNAKAKKPMGCLKTVASDKKKVESYRKIAEKEFETPAVIPGSDNIG